MIEKNKQVKKLIKLVNNIFGNDIFTVVNYWCDESSIGLKKDNKLIYVCIYNKNGYFYESEILLDDPEEPYIVQDSENVSEEQLLEVISKFFEIERKKLN
ncbi:hypothetical protein [Rickettsia endosymbiont of Orchestes rusci]|uniref:hypothetical protein n=1 Tax=Rickettsia endosymbiont of Orchestes rusci TaxID=3066250 RepID=UPI00313D3FCA